MQHYDIAQLSDPATYATDAALATLARHTAARMFDDTLGLSRGDLKRAFLAGQHPEQMLAAVDTVCATERAVAAMRSDAVTSCTTWYCLPDRPTGEGLIWTRLIWTRKRKDGPRGSKNY